MTVNEFLKIFADTLEVSDEVTLNTKRADIAEWDSMGQISIMSMLEEKFGITLEMEELVNLEGIQDIVNILKQRNISLD